MLKINAFYPVSGGSAIARHPGAEAIRGGFVLPVSMTKTEAGFKVGLPYPGGKIILQATEGRHGNMIYAVAGGHGEALFADKVGNMLVFTTNPNWDNVSLLIASIDDAGNAELSRVTVDGNTINTNLVWKGNVSGRQHLLGMNIPEGLGVLTAALRMHAGEHAHYVRAS